LKVDMTIRACLLGFLLTAAMSTAQTAKPEIPHLYDGKPDLSGVWDIPYTPDMGRGVQGGLPFTPVGADDFKNYDPAKFDYTGHCLPAGLTRLVNTPMPMEIVQTPKRTVFLFEGFSSYIVVPTDGRKHTKDPDPTWYGESIGWYEGDTLVVDSVGFNDKTRLDTIGHGHSDQLHVIQRFTRTDAKAIAFEITIEDPKMYAKPFTNKRTFRLNPGELIEYSCMENNKDLLDGHIK
jgi:hypothetical protein